MSSPQFTTTSKAKALYQTGNLTEAINQLIEEVRNNPTDNWRRTFLFELLCFNGEWERAERQLKGLLITGANAEIGLLVYGNNIKAEITRNKLFSSGTSPEFLITPPDNISLKL
jgi:type VI secretion system protein ImpE